MVLTLLEESIWGSDATALAVLLVMSANVRMLLVCASGLHAKKGLIGQPCTELGNFLRDQQQYDTCC